MNTVYCIYCNEAIHPMRLEILPKTKTCVKCSKEGKKAGRLVSHGQGEEVETTLEILDQETAKKIFMLEKGMAPAEESFFSFDEEE